MPDARRDAAENTAPDPAPDASQPPRPAVSDARGRRAAAAEAAVSSAFSRRLAGLPATRMARIGTGGRVASLGGLRGPWHYWWQAHHLDAVVDAGLRHLREGDSDGAVERARTGDRVLATIRLRNGNAWTNDFYDDMAWLALASGRLGRLHGRVERRRGSRRLRSARRALTAELRSAMTDDLGGGLFWSTDRDFKNVPASGPAALHLARLGDLDAARRVVDWVWEHLRHEDTGLLADGLRLHDGAPRLVPDVWSYNQGTVLGALVTVGDPRSLERAAGLVDAVDAHLAVDANGRRVLRTHGTGDGGLFTGILCRYLVLAAETEQLDAGARAVAARLVRDTADALWAGRDSDTGAAGRLRGGVHAGRVRGRGVRFSTDPLRPAAEMLEGARSLELAPQLQAWTILEAAARLG